MRNKIDNRIYALKKVPMHVRFDPDINGPNLQHTAMKEIEAISKLNHENIVGYKGCWVEAEKVDLNRLEKILSQIK